MRFGRLVVRPGTGGVDYSGSRLLRKATRRADDTLQVDMQARDERDGGHATMVAHERAP